jgi:hypothetical protein
MTAIAETVTRSNASAGEVASVAEEIQRISEALRVEIPGIVRRALWADMRDHERFPVATTASLGFEGRTATVRVCDVSRSGAKLECPEGIATGQRVTVTVRGSRALEARVAWAGGGHCGVQFEIPGLDDAELRSLVGEASTKAA